MNRKRNVNYTKPEDPEFLKLLKKQVGYDDRNHKFDKLKNAEEDFVDDEESEKPQVVVLGEGDLTAEEAELEQKRLNILESATKADLSKRVIFKPKLDTLSDNNKRKQKDIKTTNNKKNRHLLSFNDEEDEDL